MVSFHDAFRRIGWAVCGLLAAGVPQAGAQSPDALTQEQIESMHRQADKVTGRTARNRLTLQVAVLFLFLAMSYAVALK